MKNDEDHAAFFRTDSIEREASKKGAANLWGVRAAGKRIVTRRTTTHWQATEKRSWQKRLSCTSPSDQHHLSATHRIPSHQLAAAAARATRRGICAPEMPALCGCRSWKDSARSFKNPLTLISSHKRQSDNTIRPPIDVSGQRARTVGRHRRRGTTEKSRAWRAREQGCQWCRHGCCCVCGGPCTWWNCASCCSACRRCSWPPPSNQVRSNAPQITKSPCRVHFIVLPGPQNLIRPAWQGLAEVLSKLKRNLCERLSLLDWQGWLTLRYPVYFNIYTSYQIASSRALSLGRSRSSQLKLLNADGKPARNFTNLRIYCARNFIVVSAAFNYARSVLSKHLRHKTLPRIFSVMEGRGGFSYRWDI